nr:carboxypeptidase regulatory-like domain-containing protein [Nocardioides panzhihuensis]
MHVPAGTYRVLFNSGDRSGEGTPPVDSDDRWERAYHGGATVEEATDVVVTRGSTVPGIDRELAEAPNGIISGHVASTTGEAIAGLVVTSYKFYEEDWGDGQVHGFWESYRQVSTDADGNYRLYLPAGDYRVGFRQDSRNDQDPILWQAEFYNDATTVKAAETLTVALDETRSGVGAVIAANGQIAGQVTDDSGRPVSGTYVTARQLVDEGSGTVWDGVASARTGEDGSYRLHVPNGSYRIEFKDHETGLVTEYYDNATSIEQATDVVVAGSAVVSGIDAALSQGGSIEGTVTVAGSPTGDINVFLYANEGGDWTFTSDLSVDESGHYAFDGLRDGAYRLRFAPGESAAIGEYYDNASSLSEATDLVVSGANTLTADADLTAGTSIAGTVTDESGEPLRGIDVSLYQAQDDGSGSVWWDSVGWDTTTTTGSYSFDGLAAGATYRIGFVDNEGNFAREYYRDAATVERATDVIAGESGPIDVALASDAGAEVITGAVTDDAGNPVAGVTVEAYRTDTWDEAGSVTTGADGTYRLDGLRAGPHQVSFSLNDDYLYTDEEPYRLVDVVAGTAAVEDLQVHVGGRVTGTLRDADGQPIRDAYVTAYTADGFEWSGQGYVEVDGNYTVRGLPSGTYRLEFTSNAGHRPEWFSDKSSFDEADVVTVNLRETTTANAELALGARATGVVTHHDGTPHAWEYVMIERDGGSGWEYTGEAWTDESGRYATGALDPGTYRIRADAYDGIHVTTFSKEFTVTDAEQVVRDIQMQRPVVTNTAAPTIEGTGIVGEKLAATSGEWDTDGVTHTYEWLRDGQAIDGAVAETYVLADADAGHRVGVRVTATKEGYVAGNADSQTISVSHGPLVSSQPPVVTGVPKVGETLGVDPGTWSTDGVTYGYQWLRDGEAIAGATGASYLLNPNDHGHTFSVKVSATKETWEPGTAVSKPTVSVELGDLVLEPKVAGDVRIGSTLTASTDAPAGATVTYSWQVRSPAAEPSADTFKEVGTDASFEVRDRHKNYALRLVVTVVADGYKTATVPVDVSDRLR